jgi:glycosyltransferase involved in cell wall biosynthesis
VLHVIQNALPTQSGEPLERADARSQLGLPAEGFVAGWVGRLAPAKAVDVFIEAMAHVMDIPVVGSIIGEGEDRVSGEARALELGLATRLHWHGFLPDAASLLRAMDVIVMSSRSEGTPIILLEAMAAGIPLVVTAVGGIPDVVSTGEAILVTSEDMQGLAAAIRRVYSDPAGARERSESASKRVRDFGVNAWLDRHDQLYDKLIVSRRQPHPRSDRTA